MMINESKNKGSRRLLTRIAITGALVVAPMAAIAAPAFAATVPGVVQADRTWQSSSDRDHHYRDQNHQDNQDPNGQGDQNQNPNLPDVVPWPPLPNIPNPFPFVNPFSGLFGSS